MEEDKIKVKNGNGENISFLKRAVNSYRSKEAVNVVVKYGVFGVLWILLSDTLLEMFAGDFIIYKHLQTYKGGLFVLITMVLVYILVNSRVKKAQNALDESSKAIKDLRHMAYYDTLTGLPNRVMFVSKIKNLIDKSKEEFAIAFIDIDNFKYINDTIGHYAGDDFLKFVGNKISADIRAPNLVAHIGGDEFAILIKNFESKEKVINKLENILNSIGSTWNSGNREFFISMSIGVAVYPYDGSDFDTLFKHSDIAMYAAKKEGKNKILFYEEEIQEEILMHFKMANKLQKGLEKKEFELYYQPQIELSTGRITGLEALVRWNSSEYGFISPEEFIPVAEITGQIYDLDRRIIENVLVQKREWERQGISDLEVSVNLSSKSLISSLNFKRIEIILSEYKVDYADIVVEITETAVISNIETVIERLNVLKNKGVKIALDDFGTGYSSITYLKMLPIDIVKLDKSYINSKNNDIKDFSIVKFIVMLSHDLGFKVVAEGIETHGQLDYLKSIKCECGQGYLLGKPMRVGDINAIINPRH